jgi:hypothetical protein
MSTSKPQQLIEGVDYYMENGKLVLKAAYLLKRGFCCNHGCRHCPYRGANAASPPLITIVGLPPIKPQ